MYIDGFLDEFHQIVTKQAMYKCICKVRGLWGLSRSPLRMANIQTSFSSRHDRDITVIIEARCGRLV